MILQQLLAEHELPDDSYRFELTHDHYPLRPFCIQYEETDLACCNGCARRKAFTITSNTTATGTFWCSPTTA
jgi:uncharacterized protein involved in type VI secretion and phage assembly